MLGIELYQISLTPGRGRSEFEISLNVDSVTFPFLCSDDSWMIFQNSRNNRLFNRTPLVRHIANLAYEFLVSFSHLTSVLPQLAETCDETQWGVSSLVTLLSSVSDRLPPRICEPKLPHTTHNSLIRSDEGLMLETSAFESLYGGQFTLSTQLIEPNYSVISVPDFALQDRVLIIQNGRHKTQNTRDKYRLVFYSYSKWMCSIINCTFLLNFHQFGK